MPCTTILVGKKATHDGSTLMARTEDSAAGAYSPKQMTVVHASQQPRHYQSVISKVIIELPDDPMRYTAMPNADPEEGIWAAAGINEANVAMTATETITSNPRMEGADPLDEHGIGEEDIVSIVLPYIHSAREGVLRLGSLLEKFGTYERNGIGFQDKEELWWLESLGGHHWIAKRIPDDCYMVCPNQQGIDSFDFVDAMGDKKEHLCSDDLCAFVEDHFLNLGFESTCTNTHFDVRAAFGSRSDSDRVYNTPRAWFIERYLNPNTYIWDGEDPDFSPESMDLPWCLQPEKRITPEDIKYLLSSYYQGTPYNPYSKHSVPTKRGKYRTIGINRTNVMVMTQLRPYMPDGLVGVEWVAFGSGAFNEMIPIYTNIRRVPEYLSTGKDVSTEDLYWANRLIAALADANYGQNIPTIERYQRELSVKSRNHLYTHDRTFLEMKTITGTDLQPELEQANDQMADIAKEITNRCLAKVLLVTSDCMKNAFSRSDS